MWAAMFDEQGQMCHPFSRIALLISSSRAANALSCLNGEKLSMNSVTRSACLDTRKLLSRRLLRSLA